MKKAKFPNITFSTKDRLTIAVLSAVKESGRLSAFLAEVVENHLHCTDHGRALAAGKLRIPIEDLKEYVGGTSGEVSTGVASTAGKEDLEGPEPRSTAPVKRGVINLDQIAGIAA